MTTVLQDPRAKQSYVNLIISGAAWIIFVYTWVRLVMRTIAIWHVVQVDIHYDLIAILLFFGAMWVKIVRGKRDAYDLLFVALTLTAVGDLVPRLM